MYLYEFHIHTHLCWYKENFIAIKRFGKKMREDQIYWWTNIIEVLRNTEKLGKIRLWPKDKWCLLGSVDYTLLKITCYNLRYIFTFLPETLQSMQNDPPFLVYDPPSKKKKIAGSMVNYSSNNNSKLFSLGSIFNRVNIQHKKLHTKKNASAKLLKNDPDIFSTLCLNFQRRKSTQGSIFNVEKWTPGQFSTKFKILRYNGNSMINFTMVPKYLDFGNH